MLMDSPDAELQKKTVSNFAEYSGLFTHSNADETDNIGFRDSNMKITCSAKFILPKDGGSGAHRGGAGQSDRCPVHRACIVSVIRPEY
jgi:hypothetical protein